MQLTRDNIGKTCMVNIVLRDVNVQGGGPGRGEG